MKNTILILTVIIGINHLGWSQNSKLQIGIDGGLNLANVHRFKSGYFQPVAKVGYSFSTTFQYNFNPKLAIVTGIGFEQKGLQAKEKWALTDKFGNVMGEYRYRNVINYINVPLMARYTFGKQDFRLFASFGGYMGLLLESYTYFVGYEPEEDSKIDNTSDMESIDLGIAAGLGVNYAVTGKLNLTFEIRNNFGLYDVGSEVVSIDGQTLLYSANFLFGINFGLGSK